MKETSIQRKNIWQTIKQARLREWIFVASVALLLLCLGFVLFGEKSEAGVAVESEYVGTDTEKKLAAILQEIEGVGSVQVMIGQTEDGVKSVVVVCDGAKSIRVMMDVREAAAAAVGTTQDQVKIYIKENN